MTALVHGLDAMIALVASFSMWVGPGIAANESTQQAARADTDTVLGGSPR